MTYNEVEKILMESSKEDWVNFVEVGKEQLTYKNDLNLVILKDIETKEDPIKINNLYFTKKEQYPCWYDIYYKTSLVVRVKMLIIDNGRSIIPFLIYNNRTVKKRDANIARILNVYNNTDEFILNAGLAIVD